MTIITILFIIVTIFTIIVNSMSLMTFIIITVCTSILGTLFIIVACVKLAPGACLATVYRHNLPCLPPAAGQLMNFGDAQFEAVQADGL